MARSTTTIQSDTWDSIAYRLWGEERHLNLLRDANPEHADTLIFPAGVVLNLPDTPARPERVKGMPPWI